MSIFWCELSLAKVGKGGFLFWHFARPSGVEHVSLRRRFTLHCRGVFWSIPALAFWFSMFFCVKICFEGTKTEATLDLPRSWLKFYHVLSWLCRWQGVWMKCCFSPAAYQNAMLDFFRCKVCRFWGEAKALLAECGMSTVRLLKCNVRDDMATARSTGLLRKTIIFHHES